MPTSRVARPDGSWGTVFHSVNTGKPGLIAVLRNGQRFVDESVPYHYFVQRMLSACEGLHPPGCYLICDQGSFSRYGLGYAKPLLPLRGLLGTQYLYRGDTVEDLARQIDVPEEALRATIEAYNAAALDGKDPQFGKGLHRFGRYMGDSTHPVGINVAPLRKGPFYAVWAQPGDIGSFAGVRTDSHARVVRKNGSVVEGLFAVGNDMASAFRGHYPGGGSMLGPAMTFGYAAGRALVDGDRSAVMSESSLDPA